MQPLRVTDLGKYGLNSDIPPAQLPINAWTSASNVRCENNAVKSAIGESLVCALPCKPVYHTNFIGFSGITRILVSDGFKVYSVNPSDASYIDITPGPDWLGGRVSFANLNGVMVVNSQTDGPWYWPGPANDLLALPGWDSTWRCKEMVAYKYFLVALAMYENTDDYPHKIRWSNSAAEGAIPTDWVAAVSNDAGDDILGESPGEITGGVKVRDDLWIVKEDAVYAMRWIGGQYVMQTERLAGSIGSSIPKGYVEMNGALAVLTTSDLMLFDGVSIRSLVNGRVRDLISDTTSDEYWSKSQLYVHVPTSSLYVCVIEAGYDRLSMALVYDWSQNTWTSRSLMNGYGLAEAVVSLSGSSVTWDTLADPGASGWSDKTWDELVDVTWDRGVYESSTPDVVLFQSNVEDDSWWMSVLGNSDTNWDGSAKFEFVERIGIPIEETARLAMIVEIWPEVKGTIPVSFKVGSQMVADGDVTWSAPVTITPGQTARIPVRLTGRHLCWRIESNGAGSWSFGALTAKWEYAGER